MGCQPVAGNQVGIFRQSPGNTAMQVHRGRNHRFLTNDLPYPADQITLRVIQSNDTHGSMDIKKHPIIGHVFAQHVKHFCHQGFISFSGHSPSRQRPGIQGRKPLRSIPIEGVLREKRIKVENLLTPTDPKSIHLTHRRRKSTGLNGNARNGNTW